MVAPRTSYRSAVTAPDPEEGAFDAPDEREEVPVRDRVETRGVPPARRDAPTRSAPSDRGSGSYGGNRGAQGKQQGDGEFITVTGLFPTKSGKADTAFVKDDIYEHLKNIRPGDTIGVSMNKKTNRLQLWYIQKG